MRRADAHRIQHTLAKRGERIARLRELAQTDHDGLRRLPSAAGGIQARRFGNRSDDVEEGRRAGSGGGGAERAQPILARCGAHPVDDRHPGAGPPSDDVAEQVPQDILVEQVGGRVPDIEEDLRPAVLGAVQARIGHPAGDRRAHVDERAVQLGACPEHGVGEHHRVGLVPRDLVAEPGPPGEMVGRAGQRLLAAHPEVEVHELANLREAGASAPVGRAVQEVRRRGIQRRRHRQPCPRAREPAGEVEPCRAGGVAAPDVGGADVDEPRCARDLGRLDDEAHREPRAVAGVSGEQSAVMGAQVERHVGSGAGRGRGSVSGVRERTLMTPISTALHQLPTVAGVSMKLAMCCIGRATGA